MRGQTLRALDEGDVVIFVVDAREGLTAVDEDVARLLRRTGKPVFIAANKVDSSNRDAAAAEAFALGYDQVFPVSATHGRGVGELLDEVIAVLGDRVRLAPEPDEPGRGRRRGVGCAGAVGRDPRGIRG
jgi:GTP-binding protein